jgi:hypothetical protein
VVYTASEKEANERDRQRINRGLKSCHMATARVSYLGEANGVGVNCCEGSLYLLDSLVDMAMWFV